MSLQELKQNKAIITITAVLVAGLLLHSVIMAIIYKNFNPHEIVDISLNTLNWRLYCRKIAESFFSLSSTIYIIGHIMVVYRKMKRNQYAKLKDITLYFIVQLIIMLACTIPFGMFGFNHFGDYIFPIWSTASVLALVLLIYYVVSVYKTSKKRNCNNGYIQ